MELIIRMLCVAVVFSVCFAGAIKTGKLYFPKANGSALKTVIFITVCLLQFLFDFENYLIGSLLRQAVFIGYLFVLFKGKSIEKLGTFTAYTAVLEFAWDGIDEILGACTIRLQENSIVIYAVACVSWTAASLIAYLLFSKTKIAEGRFLKGGKMLFVSSGLLMVLIDVCGYGVTKGVVMVSRENGDAFYDQIFTHIEVFVLSVLCMTICVALLFGMNRLFGYDLTEDVLRKEIGHYKAMAEQYRDQVNVRHDMKNHLISLTALAEKHEWGKLTEYLSKISAVGLVGEDTIDTGNPVINALMNIKQQISAEKDIEFACDMSINGQLATDEYDLCVIYGNILDNAIKAAEAAKNERFVNVRTETVKNHLVIDVKNSADNLPDKFDIQNYGTGLMNVRKIVEKAKGIMEIQTNKDIFEISILLPIAQ